MKHVFLTLLTLLVSFGLRAQECAGIKLKAGTTYEMLSYNSKDKQNGRILYTFKNVRREGPSTIIDVVMQSFDEKGKAAQEIPLTYTCTGNEIIADLSGMAQTTNQGMRDMQMKMKVNAMNYPHKLAEGQALPDGRLEAELFNKDTKMMDMNMLVTERKVIARENLTIPAGTYNAYKVSSAMNLENRTMGIPIRMGFQMVNYRSPEVLFDLRTETYNKNGKLMAYTVLSKVQ